MAIANRSRTRQELWDFQGGICWLCDRPMKWGGATFDHVKPKADGGSDTFSNLRLAHHVCNRIRDRLSADIARERVQVEVAQYWAKKREKRMQRRAARQSDSADDTQRG